jgi:hypothetical protein
VRALSVKALLLAIGVTLLLDLISGVVIMIAAGAPVSPGMTEQQISDAAAAFLNAPGVLVQSVVLGTLSTVVGGYIAARIGSDAPYWNAGAFGVFGILLGALLGYDLPLWFNAIGFALAVPSALLGGWLAARKTVVPVE